MQINRFFEIIYILLDKKTITARELAERFEVSTRTIYRDIETLSSAGIPVYMSKGKGGGISILEDFVLNKTVLTEDEKSDVLSSLRAVDAISFNQTDSALQKLGSLLGEYNTNWIEVDFSSWYNSEKEADLFYDIKTAILSKKTVCFSYSSEKGEQTKREVEPLKLCFKDMSRYLYAYCTLRQDFRFFKLSRIRDLLLTDRQFERTAVEPVFKEKNLFREQYISLKLRLSPQMAFRVFEEFDSYTMEDDGSFIAEINYPNGKWLFPYIASFGIHCEVLEPPDLRVSIQRDLKKMLENYL